MARIASQSKGGFYATPEGQMSLILPRLKVNEGERYLNLFDPCAGEGLALKQLGDHFSDDQNLTVQTFGVELEETRFQKARDALDQVIHDGYENVRTEANFNVVWLNPPYDEVFHERTELRFLRTLSSKSKNIFANNSLLMFCVPQYVLDKCAMVLSERFREIKVYRFTDNAYDVFKQVVVFGYFGTPGSREKVKETRDYLKDIANKGPEILPTLEEIEENFYVDPSDQPITLFRAGKLNSQELFKDLQHSTLFSEFEKRVTPEVRNSSMKRPLLPLKLAHAGTAIASGAVGGNLGNHMVVGITKPVTELSEVLDDEGLAKKEVYTKHHKSVIRAFTRNGIFELQ
ncbi:hypothetical protein BKP35_12215 [Anaerobacillus arseniciselenatis]|uniref:DUF6094 domain-containing protein n=1 Tax=Anaerobacillus arseniciselenatis TaxID=85682 RepID=A0A1S2LGJ9_9BACI|nr:DUF6094 domain-containing protein [Anaerobacillus arseniciselenatis]OIJ11501.1 hypothetical protein BKP35_12215 [Anaerobacillus arseniciselenatis]